MIVLICYGPAEKNSVYFNRVSKGVEFFLFFLTETG